MKSTVFFLLGLVIVAVGVLFALQGADVVRWPRESFMVGAREWIEYGVAVVLIGLGFILAARRLR